MFSFKFILRYKSVSLLQVMIHKIPQLRAGRFRTNAKFSFAHEGSMALSSAHLIARHQEGNWLSGLPASNSTQVHLNPLWISCGNPPLCPLEKETIILFFLFFPQEEKFKSINVLVRDSIDILAGMRRVT